ncbi:hypothetical protein, partial [Geobacillus jurassicus]|uniref:hypothetical protein n=1 Tax=Geobacillus jurassicus TaxID=235932 RepID=UPI001C3F245F
FHSPGSHNTPHSLFFFFGAICVEDDLTASQMAMRDRPFCFALSMPVFRSGSSGMMFGYGTISKARVEDDKIG